MKMKTIAMTEEEYQELMRTGRECGFDMDSAGRKGQRKKFILIAAKIAKFQIMQENLERRENANS